jgi:hypothetical protein
MVTPNNSVDSLVIRLLAIEPQHRLPVPVAITGTIADNALDRLKQFPTAGPWRVLAPILPVLGVIGAFHHMTAPCTKGQADEPCWSSPGNAGGRASHFFPWQCSLFPQGFHSLAFCSPLRRPTAWCASGHPAILRLSPWTHFRLQLPTSVTNTPYTTGGAG